MSQSGLDLSKYVAYVINKILHVVTAVQVL